ncbi:cation:proton antiporter [Nicoliella spurrieriana]|uniref:Cation:proton antiporter n=1 Tax=Nicoliella spurrieriana TaxID=2925830 RepID=A0A976RSC7_9LACO|nr:cation:proton antiporter [Nicoliella spurrieriana]UQS86947.1 cation:proton antiporter [Nicoliella spurrieriana]
MEFLFEIILILASAFLMGKLAEWLKVPIVVGQLLAGLLIGPGLFNWIHLTSLLQALANLGVIILMFLAGLNSDIKLLKKYLTPSLVVALLGIALPMGLISAFGLSVGWPLKDALFLGVIFSATSVSITVEVLREMKRLNSKEGTTILGAAVADDVLTVILLGLTVTLTGERLTGQITAGMNSFLVIGLQVLFFVGVFLAAKYAIVPLLQFARKINLPNATPIVALVIALCFSAVAELIGLSAITGAFFAGLAMSQHQSKRQIDTQIGSLGYLLLIPIFFVSIGLEMKWSGIFEQLWLFIGLTLIAIVAKLVGAGLGGKLVGFNARSSLIIGAGMVSRGEVALIIAQIVYANHLLSIDQYSAIVGAIIAATIVSPFILKFSYPKA